jgi:hypothetical protein
MAHSPRRINTTPPPTHQRVEPEIAYHPRRHDFMLVRGTGGDDIDGRLDQIGYQFIATDGQTWLWYRDRLAAARNALEHTSAPAFVNKSLGL